MSQEQQKVSELHKGSYKQFSMTFTHSDEYLNGSQLPVYTRHLGTSILLWCFSSHPYVKRESQVTLEQVRHLLTLQRGGRGGWRASEPESSPWHLARDADSHPAQDIQPASQH